MTDKPDIHQDPRLHALIIAHDGGHPAEAVLERATKYHGFLTTGATGKPATAPAAGKPATPQTAGGKSATAPAAGGKPATAPAANKPAAAPGAPKAPAAKAAAPATAKTPAAGAPKAAPPSDTKDPNGHNTYGDVVKALQAVNAKINKAVALDILLKNGNGATSVRDLKPALYDAVVDASNAAISDEAADAGAEDPTAGPETDELGNPV